ncbi:8-amino-7-oxononanoate synthase [Hydrotalea sp.]|uniref:aminotransferase class I/II-fold pyridoxal phosphate-dependent enzyme n=1 Tax=Hydrotalea sp. TaxID=2881279 RepID=UPI00260CA62D|nr:8-amino-7-oxononanoate synthase [Hydrotalea sp.]
MYCDEFLDNRLNDRKLQGLYRTLPTSVHPIDFFSNDYLGIARQKLLSCNDVQQYATGATGSRLLSGNYALIEEAEKRIANFHQTPAALIFNSGYDANIGVLSAIPQKGDTILYDALSHASIREGVRLSFAQSFSFRHNEMPHLEERLQQAKGQIFIVTETVFSMDGDCCPLPDLIVLAQKYGAHLIVDEAHATGIIGKNGEGLTQYFQLQEAVFARVHTFGKAIGCQGAVVLGSERLRNYLINFSRPFIYTTALPPLAIKAIIQSYAIFPEMHAERQVLQQHIQTFQQAKLPCQKLTSTTPIQGLVIPGNEQVRRIAENLQKNGLAVRPILYPTVPKNAERLRIILHSFNTAEQLHQLLQLLIFTQNQ